MFGINLNELIVRSCARLIRSLPGIQQAARKRLVKELQGICSKCDDAYSALIKRLAPIKSAYGEATALAKQLRRFAADDKTRAAFKPEKLCGEIDQLLQELKSNLSSLGYSVAWSGLETLDETLRRMGNYDGELYHQYDQFRFELDQIATELDRAKKADQKRWMRYVEDLINDTEVDLRQAISGMRNAKNHIVKTAF